MQVLVIAPTPFFSDRGCHIRIYEQVQALIQAGHTPIVYTYHNGRDEGDAEIIRIKKVSWYRKTAAGPAWGKFILDIKLLVTIFKTAKHYKFDIIHAHLHEGAWIGWWVQRWLHIPLVLDAQGSLVSELESHAFFSLPGMRWLFKRLEHWITTHVDYIFVSSRAMLTTIAQGYPDQLSHTRLLADCTSSQTISDNDPLTEQLRTKWNISSNRPTVMYTGGLSVMKGIDTLLESIPAVVSAIPNAQFVIVGYPDIDRCKVIVQELDVTSSVLFTGHVRYPELPYFLSMADCAVDPKPAASTEASGKLLNYMAAGLPIIAFESENSKSTLGNSGVLISHTSVGNLSEAIISLLRNPSERARLGKAAQYRLTQQPNWNDQINELVAIYKQLCQQ